LIRHFAAAAAAMAMPFVVALTRLMLIFADAATPIFFVMIFYAALLPLPLRSPLMPTSLIICLISHHFRHFAYAACR